MEILKQGNHTVLRGPRTKQVLLSIPQLPIIPIIPRIGRRTQGLGPVSHSHFTPSPLFYFPIIGFGLSFAWNWFFFLFLYVWKFIDLTILELFPATYVRELREKNAILHQHKSALVQGLRGFQIVCCSPWQNRHKTNSLISRPTLADTATGRIFGE